VGAGYPRSALIGATFAAAWSPCIGPILGAVLTLAAASGTALQGALLLVAYSLGLGVWFLAFGAAFGWLAPRLRRVQRFLPVLMAVSGALFIVVGAAMFLGAFGRLNAYFQSVGFLFGGTSDAEAELVSRTGGVLGPAIAAFGGLVSFLSPCVLPVVPVYLANLAGEAALTGPNAGRDRARVVLHAATFVLGFTFVFAALGASAGLFGNALLRHIDIVTRAGGLLLIAMGLQLSGLVHLPYLERTYQLPAPGPTAGR
jgi:cytochrome c biogenesis protein CcdA